MVCEVRVNAINTLRRVKVIDDTRKIINDELFERANKALTDIAIKRYGLETNGQMLFDKTSKKILDERNSTYYRDTTFKVERAEPNVALFDQLQILKTKYDNNEAIAKQSVIPDNNPAYMRQDLDNTKFTLHNNASRLNLSQPQIEAIYENYVKLMDRKKN